MNKKVKWAIIGGGNGGQAMAGHVALKGFDVKIYDVCEETCSIISDKGGIDVTGAVEGFGKVDMASTDMSKVLEGADIAVVVLPSLYHASIAKKCAPFLKDGQVVVLHPGASCGALEFKRVLEEEGCKADVAVAEANTLLYACRAATPGNAHIFGTKNFVTVAALPATENKKVLELLNSAFPEFIEAKNVIQTSLENLNAIMHPAPSILNVARIESGIDWQYYYDGFTPSIGGFVEEIDKERIEIGKVYGLDLMPITDWYRKTYDAKGDTLSELVQSTRAYDGIKGQKTLKTRYLLEDVPNSLKAIASLGKKAGVSVEKMDLVVRLCEIMLEGDISTEGRTVENLGIDKLSTEDIISYVELGR